MRLLYLILLGILLGAAIVVLHVVTAVQFIIMLVDRGQPNSQIAAFGKSLGSWLSTAVRFQTAQSEDGRLKWDLFSLAPRPRVQLPYAAGEAKQLGLLCRARAGRRRGATWAPACRRA